jgi:AcrR family transcriptional regulator
LGDTLSSKAERTETEAGGAVPDGRRLRSERSRQAIIDASIDLINGGVLVPTAQLISERASVGIRSFFRHFVDMESLFKAVEIQTRESTEALFIGGDRDGSLAERILHAVERRSEGYENQRNIILTTAAQSWRHEILRKNYARYQRGLRKYHNDWLPELSSVSSNRREMIDAAASFEMWHRLRFHQNLSKKTSVQIIVEAVTDLMNAP